jgi:hypothetical protein
MLEAVVRSNLQLIVTRWDVVGLDKQAISRGLRVQGTGFFDLCLYLTAAKSGTAQKTKSYTLIGKVKRSAYSNLTFGGLFCKQQLVSYFLVKSIASYNNGTIRYEKRPKVSYSAAPW